MHVHVYGSNGTNELFNLPPSYMWRNGEDRPPNRQIFWLYTTIYMNV